MQSILIEFIPIIAFFITYKVYDIYIATVVCIISIILQMLIHYIKHKKLNNSQIITLVAISILGGATLLLHNELFIKWKPTVVYWIFSLGFILSPIFIKQPLTKKLFTDKFNLSDKNWQKLNHICSSFFAAMGIINLWIVYNYNTSTWVNFKLFGSLILSIIFAIIVGKFIQNNSIKEPN